MKDIRWRVLHNLEGGALHAWRQTSARVLVRRHDDYSVIKRIGRGKTRGLPRRNSAFSAAEAHVSALRDRCFTCVACFIVYWRCFNWSRNEEMFS